MPTEQPQPTPRYITATDPNQRIYIDSYPNIGVERIRRMPPATPRLDPDSPGATNLKQQILRRTQNAMAERLLIGGSRLAVLQYKDEKNNVMGFVLSGQTADRLTIVMGFPPLYQLSQELALYGPSPLDGRAMKVSYGEPGYIGPILDITPQGHVLTVTDASDQSKDIVRQEINRTLVIANALSVTTSSTFAQNTLAELQAVPGTQAVKMFAAKAMNMLFPGKADDNPERTLISQMFGKPRVISDLMQLHENDMSSISDTEFLNVLLQLLHTQEQLIMGKFTTRVIVNPDGCTIVHPQTDAPTFVDLKNLNVQEITREIFAVIDPQTGNSYTYAIQIRKNGDDFEITLIKDTKVQGKFTFGDNPALNRVYTALTTSGEFDDPYSRN